MNLIFKWDRETENGVMGWKLKLKMVSLNPEFNEWQSKEDIMDNSETTM